MSSYLLHRRVVVPCSLSSLLFSFSVVVFIHFVDYCIFFFLYKTQDECEAHSSSIFHEKFSFFPYDTECTVMCVHSEAHSSLTAFFFFFCIFSRLSARISDFENVLLMVHVVGYMLAPQAHGTQLFFFSTPDFDFFGTFEHSPLHIFFS